MKRSVAIATAMLLASCGGQSANQAASNESGAKAVSTESGSGAAVSLQPGLWEMTMQVTRMNVPNMPAGMRVPLPAATTVRTCLTQEQVGQPNANFLTGNTEGAHCTSENMSMAGGHIQGTVQCDIQGTTTRSTLNGQFSPTSYEMTQTATVSAQGMNTETETRITARRVGDCTG